MGKSKRKIFVEEYLHDWNATQAAIRAGYSPKTAYSAGSRLLQDPAIAVEVARRIEERTMSADEVLLRLTEIARMNIADFVEKTSMTLKGKDGEPGIEIASINLKWSEIERRGYLVKSITPTAYGPKLELHDQMQALLQIGKHLQMFKDLLFDIDVSKLTDEQLERIESGEDVLSVILTGQSKNKTAGESSAGKA